MICKHLFRRPRTRTERRQLAADRADRLPMTARVRAKWRPTNCDDIPHARQPRRRHKPWSRR